jgi:hypothetical protein
MQNDRATYGLPLFALVRNRHEALEAQPCLRGPWPAVPVSPEARYKGAQSCARDVLVQSVL